jgi:hypothetical protein
MRGIREIGQADGDVVHGSAVTFISPTSNVSLISPKNP